MKDSGASRAALTLSIVVGTGAWLVTGPVLAADPEPGLVVEGLHYEDVLADVFQGNFVDLPFERDELAFEGFTGRSVGSVRVTFRDGLPECLYFFDFPQTCRSANRRIVADYAGGGYRSP